MKECRKCKKTKELSEFKYAKNRKFNVLDYCIECEDFIFKEKIEAKKIYDIEYRSKMKLNGKYEKHLNKQKGYYYNRKENKTKEYDNYLFNKKKYRIQNKRKYMFLAARKRAVLQNIPFNITVEDIIVPEYCPLLNTKIEWVENNKNLNGPSLDKIVPELGYTKGNVRVISRRANMMKLNCSFEELKLFSENIIKYINDYKENCKSKESSCS